MLQLKSTFSPNNKFKRPYFPTLPNTEVTIEDLSVEEFQPFIRERDKLGNLSRKQTSPDAKIHDGKRFFNKKHQSLMPKQHNNQQNVSKIQENLVNNQIPNQIKTIQFKTKDALQKRYHISENTYQVQDVNRPTFIFVDIASPFLKNSRFIETYQSIAHNKLKLAKQIFQTHSKLQRHPLSLKKKGRFYTDLTVNNPPVGYYTSQSPIGLSKQHHFSKQNRTFDWQNLPYYENKQQSPETPFILVKDSEEKQLVRELQQSLKHYSSDSSILKPVQKQKQLQMKLVNFDEQVMNQMGDQLNRLRQTAKKIRNDILMLTEVQIKKLNASENQQMQRRASLKLMFNKTQNQFNQQ